MKNSHTSVPGNTKQVRHSTENARSGGRSRFQVGFLPLLVTISLCCSLAIAACGILAPGAGQDVNQRFAAGGYGSNVPARPLDSFQRLPGVTNFSFLVFTDLHQHNASRPRHPFYAWLGTWLSNTGPTPAFALLSGDCTESGTEEELDLLLQGFDGLPGSFPVYFTLGNHDILNQGWDSYLARLGCASYSFTAGNARIIALDSASGVLGEDQMAWLEATLQQNTNRHVFVFTHYPATMGSYMDLDRTPDPAECAWRMYLYERYGLRAEFAGHIHYYQQFAIQGVHYFTLSALKEYVSDKMMLRVRINGNSVEYDVIPVEASYE